LHRQKFDPLLAAGCSSSAFSHSVGLRQQAPHSSAIRLLFKDRGYHASITIGNETCSHPFDTTRQISCNGLSLSMFLEPVDSRSMLLSFSITSKVLEDRECIACRRPIPSLSTLPGERGFQLMSREEISLSIVRLDLSGASTLRAEAKDLDGAIREFRARWLRVSVPGLRVINMSILATVDQKPPTLKMNVDVFLDDKRQCAVNFGMLEEGPPIDLFIWPADTSKLLRLSREINSRNTFRAIFDGQRIELFGWDGRSLFSNWVSVNKHSIQVTDPFTEPESLAESAPTVPIRVDRYPPGFDI
jgi:hypothetical protein